MKKIIVGLVIFFIIILLIIPFVEKTLNRSNKSFLISNINNSEYTDENCIDKPAPTFSHHITDLSKVILVQPGGGVEYWGNEKIIKSHSYIQVKGEVPIYAPVDSIAYEGVNYMEEGMEQYSVFFQITCDVFYLFDHIHKPVDKIKKEFTKKATEDSRTFPIGPVEFKAGELIGYTTGTRSAHHFDFGVYDMNTNNTYAGYAGVDIAERDRWSVCPFDFFSEEMKKEYTSRFGTIKSEDIVPNVICK